MNKRCNLINSNKTFLSPLIVAYLPDKAIPSHSLKFLSSFHVLAIFALGIYPHTIGREGVKLCLLLFRYHVRIYFGNLVLCFY